MVPIARVLALPLMSGALLWAREARATPKQECSNAYDATQALRKASKLQDARAQAALCTRDVCAAFIRDDCAKWLGEIDTAQPTVVFDVKDANGHDATAVEVALDGHAWLPSLDGTSKAIDPGQHTIDVTASGGAHNSQTVVIREGEKNRKLSVNFQQPTTAAAPAAPSAPAPNAPTPTAPQPESDGGSGGRYVGPAVLIAVGGAALITGAVTGGLVIKDKSTFDANCSTVTKTCNATGKSAEDQGKTLGPVTTVMLAVGGTLAVTGIVWLAVVPHRKSSAAAASFVVVPIALPHLGGVGIEGAF